MSKYHSNSEGSEINSGFGLQNNDSNKEETFLLFKYAFDHADPAFFLEGGRIIYANESLCNLLGYSPSDISSVSLRDIEPDFDPAILEKRRKILFENGKNTYEKRIRSSEGKIIPIEISTTLCHFQDRTLVFAQVRDITERKRHEEELRQQEQMFRTLAENIPDLIYRYDRECKRLYVNPVVERISGKSALELVGSTPSDGSLLVSEQSRKLIEGIQRVFATGESEVLEIDYRLKGGVHRDYHMLLIPERNFHGEIETVLAIARDVTAIRETERRLTHFMNVVPGYAFTYAVDRNEPSRFSFISPGIKEILGFTSGEIVADAARLNSIIHPEDKPLLQHKIAGSMATGTPYILEYRVQSPIKGEIWLETRATPELTNEGNFLFHGISFDITARKKAEQQQSELQRQLQVITDNLPGAVDCYRMHPDGSGEMLYANRGLEDIFGFTCEDLAEDITPMAYRMHPEDLPLLIETIREATKTLSTFSGEFRVNHPEKGEIWVEQITTPVYESEHSILCYGMMFDITERKRLENELRRREEEFRSLAENITDNIARWDNQGRYIYINPTLERTLDRAGFEVIGKTKSEAFPDGRFAEVEAAILQVIATGKGMMCLRQHILVEGGEMRFHDINLIPEFDDAGQVVRILGIGRDMTDIYRMQEELAARERDYRTLAENLPDLVFRYDRDCRRIFLNKAVESVSDIPSSDLLGKTPTEAAILSAADSMKLQQSIQRILDTGRQEDVSVQMIARDGSTRFFQNLLVPEFGPDGRSIESVLSVARDITWIRLAEEELKLKEFALDQSHEAAYLIDENDLCFVYVNEAACRSLGYSRDELISLTLPDIDPFFTSEKGAALVARLNARGTFTLESRHRRSDGSSFPVEIHISRIDYHGRRLNLSLARDITERKRMQEALVERERQFRSLAENMPDNVARWDTQSRYTYLNPTHEQTVRVFAKDVLGKSLTEVFGGTLPDGMTGVEKVLAIGKPLLLERVSVPGKDGETRFHDVNVVPEFDEAGNIVSVLGIGRDMTGIYRMQDAIAAREQEFRSLAESSPDSIIRYDREGRIRYLNGNLMLQMGLESLEEVVGRLPHEVWPDGRFNAIEQAAASVVEADASQTIEISVPFPEGRTEIHDLRIVPERDAAGRVIGSIVFGRDITRLKRMEQEILAREREFRSLAENIPDNIARWDLKGRYLYVNPVHERTLGIQASELIGKPLPDTHEDVRSAIAQVVATGQAVRVDQRVPVNGVMEVHSVSIAPEFDAEGHFVSVLGIGRDMTDVFRMQESLAAREAEFRTLVEQAPEPIFRYAPDGRRIYVNATVERISGIPASQLLESDASDGKLSHSGNGKQLRELVRKVSETGEKAEMETMNIGADGRHRWFNQRFAPEFDTDGKVRSILSICHDITERKFAEQYEQFRSHILEFITGDHSLPIILEEIVRGVEQLKPETICSIMMLDSQGKCLRNGAAPNLPEFYNEAIDNLAIGQGVGSCGTCAATGERVIVEDIQTHPYWAPFKDLAARARLGACWSQPIRTSSGEILGTFAIYHRKTHSPTPQDISLIEKIAHMVSLAVERKLAKEALQKSEQLMRTVIEATPDWIFIKDLEHRYQLVNQGYANALHISPEDFIGKNDLDLGFPEELVKGDPEKGIRGFWADDRRVMESNEMQIYPDDPVTIDGAVHTFHTIKVPLRDTSGKPWGVLALARDITERKRTEVALLDREAFLESLLNAIPTPVFYKDLDGRYLGLNPAYETFFGVNRDDLVGKSVFDTHPRDLAEIYHARDLEVINSNGEIQQYEARLQHSNGERREVFFSKAPFFDTAGEIKGLIGAIIDITERKQSEKLLIERMKRISELNTFLKENTRKLEEQAAKLEASREQIKQTEAWYRTILQSAPDGIVVIDEHGNIMQVNAQIQSMFGYKDGELPGCSIEKLIPHASREAHVGIRDDFIAEGSSQRDAMIAGELFGMRKDGSIFPVDISLSQLPELDRRRNAICASVRDITEYRAMDAARESALAEALRLAQLRSAFLAQMSHELRTPLNGIIGYTRNLLLGGGLAEKQIAGLNIILDSGDHLLGLINGILDHAAIEADRFELIPGDIQLEEFLSSLIGIIRIKAEQKNIGFACDVDASLPGVVSGDAQRLRQVLLNLLSNAVNNTDRGQVTLRVGYGSSSSIRFDVEDTGVGILPDQLEKIFLPFEQVGENSRRAGGNGLGLAISRKLVQLMGGEIKVESQMGKGSVFSIEIGLEPVQQDVSAMNVAELSKQAATRVTQASPHLFVPPPQELDMLYGFALRGSMRDVMQHAEELLAGEERYRPFYEQLDHLTRSYQSKELLRLINQFRNGKGTEQ